MNRQPFTIRRAMEIQSEQMHLWKLVLSEGAYESLVKAVAAEQDRITPEGVTRPEDVVRGIDIDRLVHRIAHDLYRELEQRI